MERNEKNGMPEFEEFDRFEDGYRAKTEEGTFWMNAWEGGKVWTWCFYGNDGSYHSNFDGVPEYEENLDSPTCKRSAARAYVAMRAAYERGFSL